jgi:hypothetical protein
MWIITLTAPAAANSAAASPVTLQALLDEMLDRDAVARWPLPAFTVRQSSSYDRARIAPDKPGWFANHDNSNYIRIESHAGRQERVMMDADGPGAIVRFFLTSGGPRNGRIRVYLDNKETPAIEWRTFDLFDSDLHIGEPLANRHPAPQGHGGSNFYLPIPYSLHCKVTLEEADRAHTDARYYHIDYRTYAPGTSVETFTHAAVEAARSAIDHVNQQLANPPVARQDYSNAFDTALSAGDEKSVDLPAGPAAVRQLELSVGNELPPAVREQALRSIVLRATFDQEQDAIWCPVGDFIGSGAGGRPVSSWTRTVDAQGNAIARWTMPYHEHATLTLQNLGRFAAHVRLSAVTTPFNWDDRSMYFHTSWHQQAQIPARPFRDWNFVTVTGRGMLVGDVMSVFNPMRAWYGEGNEKIWIDRESFPSTLGTGTEDYYNASWAPNPVFQTPFANHPRIDEPNSQGQNVYTRTRCLDAIPFEKSLQFDFEIETWKDSRIDYSTTAYWYGSPGATSNIAPEPTEARRPIQALPPAMVLQGALECESLPITAKSFGLITENQSMLPFTGTWSGNAQLLIRGQKIGDFVELTIPATGDAPRRVTLYATRARDYGILKFSINGQPIDEPFDGYTQIPTPSGPIALGIFTPKDGQLILRAELTGTNEKTDGAKFFAGLDAVIISEK